MRFIGLIFSLMAIFFGGGTFVANAQEMQSSTCDLTFVGRGETTLVEEVTVENLSTGEIVTLNGTDILRLSSNPSGIDEVIGGSFLTEPRLTPNPADDEGRMIFDAPKSGKIQVAITTLSGQLKQQAIFDVTTGRHAVTLPAQAKGIYVVSVKGAGLDAACKWICLGTGDGMGDITLQDASGEQLATRSNGKPATRAVDIVEMEFHKGDLLRFVGKSGNRTTIVMNAPTCSHDITFDFYTCTDATGKHYPIVRIGDILWMAEDLGYVGSTVVPLMRNASMWEQYDASTPMAAYYDFDAGNATQGAYYNLAGAKAAMPEGWGLPSAGEVDFMVNKLGGYKAASNLLKSRGDDMWPTTLTDKDSTSFNALPYGYVTPEGKFNDYYIGVRYLTRSTKNGGFPFVFELNNSSDMKLDLNTPIDDLSYGFKVRCCRPAPTAYDNMMKHFMTDAELVTRAGSNSEGVFGNGPLGNSFTMAMGKQKILTNLSSCITDVDWHQGTTVYDSYSKKTNVNNVPSYGEYLKKAAVMNNKTGRQNMVIALWENKLLPFTKEGLGANVDNLPGLGTVSLVIIGDSTQNYAKVDSIGLKTEFTMAALDESWDWLRTGKTVLEHNLGENAELYNTTYHRHTIGHQFRIMEMYSKRFNVVCADFNGDGTDDIVVVVSRKVAIFDGETFAEITSREFNSTNVRVAVGDVDNDGAMDLTVLYGCTEEGAETCQVEVYCNGDLTVRPDFYTTVPVGAINDIKVGDVTGDGRDDIVTLTGETFADAFALRVFTHDAGQTGELCTMATINGEHKFDYSTQSGLKLKNRPWISNMNITLLHKRGSMYAADIVFGSSWYRWNDETKVLDDCVNAYGNVAPLPMAANDFRYVPSDCAWAANIDGNEEGKEVLVYLVTGEPEYTQHPWDITNKDIMFGQTKFNMDESYGFYTCWYDYAGGGGSIGLKNTDVLKQQGMRFYSTLKADQNAAAFGSEKLYYSEADAQQIAFTFPICLPVRSAEPATVLKFKSHETTMSEPRIYALMAAPPYYKYEADGVTPYEYAYDMGSAWGISTSVSNGSENSSTSTASVIAGFEQEITLPIIGTKIGEVDFTTKAEFEWTNSTSKETTVEKSNTFQSKDDDVVIMQAYFYNTYNYEVVSSGNVDAIGSTISFSTPKQPRTLMLTLGDYEMLAADDRNIPNLRQVFTHTVGEPFSYPSDKSHIKSNVRGCEVLWGAPVNGEEFIGVGTGGNANREITLTQSTSESAGFSIGVDIELVASTAGVKVGAGYGYNNSNTTTHTEGEGHTIGGTVAGLRKIGEGGLSDFRWNVCWYTYRVGNQTFPVIYYVVKK